MSEYQVLTVIILALACFMFLMFVFYLHLEQRIFELQGKDKEIVKRLDHVNELESELYYCKEYYTSSYKAYYERVDSLRESLGSLANPFKAAYALHAEWYSDSDFMERIDERIAISDQLIEFYNKDPHRYDFIRLWLDLIPLEDQEKVKNTNLFKKLSRYHSV